MSNGGKPWTYEEDIYILSDTGETLEEKSQKLKRTPQGIKIKLIKLTRFRDSVEKLEKEKKLFFEYYRYMTIMDMAHSFNRSRAYIDLRIKAYKENGVLERKTIKDSPKPTWKDKYIISNYNRIHENVLADYLGMTYQELDKRVNILRQRGLMLPETSLKGNETWIYLYDIRKPFLAEGTVIKKGKIYFVVEKDLGELILCKSKHYRECFRKVEFIINKDLINGL